MAKSNALQTSILVVLCIIILAMGGLVAYFSIGSFSVADMQYQQNITALGHTMLVTSNNPLGSYVYKTYSKDSWTVNTEASGSASNLHAGISYGVTDTRCQSFTRNDQVCIVFSDVNLREQKSMRLNGDLTINGQTYKSTSLSGNIDIGVLINGAEHSLYSTPGTKTRIDGHWEKFAGQIPNPTFINDEGTYFLSDYNGQVLGTYRSFSDDPAYAYVCMSAAYSQGCSNAQVNPAMDLFKLDIKEIPKPQSQPVPNATSSPNPSTGNQTQTSTTPDDEEDEESWWDSINPWNDEEAPEETNIPVTTTQQPDPEVEKSWWQKILDWINNFFERWN